MGIHNNIRRRWAAGRKYQTCRRNRAQRKPAKDLHGSPKV
jgi:hypothetical protein